MSQKIIKVAIPPIFGFYSRDSLLNSIVAIAVAVVVIVILFALLSDKLKQKGRSCCCFTDKQCICMSYVALNHIFQWKWNDGRNFPENQTQQAQ